MTKASCMTLAVPFLAVSLLSAAKPKQAPAAPVPAQILSAKRVFVVNAGSDEPSAFDPLFSGGPDRGYDNFCAAMTAWGRYDLVGAPSDADLLFEISLATAVRVAPAGSFNTTAEHGIYNDARFRLAIRDAKTQITLWVFIEQVEPALLRGNHDKNFDNALSKLVADLQNLAAQPAPPADATRTQ